MIKWITQGKKQLIRIKHWVLRYSEEEKFIRKALSNRGGDCVKEVGILIAAAFMESRCMRAAINVALNRISVKENMLLTKTKQYYRALLFLQKVCMQSESAKEAARKNYLKILPFVFYTRNGGKREADIRVLSISILKMTNKRASFCEETNTTYVTCISPPGVIS